MPERFIAYTREPSHMLYICVKILFLYAHRNIQRSHEFKICRLEHNHYKDRYSVGPIKAMLMRLVLRQVVRRIFAKRERTHLSLTT